LPAEKFFQDDIGSGRVREAGRIVLADVLGWRTTAQHWERIAALVAAVERAVDDGDLDALDKATADLELAVPVRSNRIEEPPRERTAIDDDLRERVNRLQHSLGSDDSVAEKGDIDDRSGGGDH
jgi:hypothetical protein